MILYLKLLYTPILIHFMMMGGVIWSDQSYFIAVIVIIHVELYVILHKWYSSYTCYIYITTLLYDMNDYICTQSCPGAALQG